MTLQQLRDKADAKLVTFWNALATWQEQNRLEFDGYRQLLVTSSVVDGVDTAYQVLTPPDLNPLSAQRNFAFAETIPFSIQVDSWGNSPSRGYKATVVVELPDGRKFTRSRSLTDTRERKMDYDEDGNSISDWYLSGTAPVIDTTAWEEVTEPTY